MSLTFKENPRPAGLQASTNTRALLTAVGLSANSIQDLLGFPDSTTDNAIARWSGTSGDAIENSGVTIDDNNIVAGAKVTPTGASTARTLEARFAEVRNVKDFGAVGDGVTDDTTAIQNAIAAVASAGGGTVFFPVGNYKVSSSLAPTIPMKFKGDGAGFEAFHLASDIHPTKITWAGGASPVFQLDNLNFGGGIEDIEINCASLATYGILMRSVMGWRFKSVWIINVAAGTSAAVKITGYSTTGSVSSWNTFEQLRMRAGTTGTALLWMSTNATTGNACHNTFLNTYIHVNNGATRDGILLDGGDNNSYIMTYIHQNDANAASKGVRVDPSIDPGFPNAEYFFHLQPGNGWYQPNTTSSQPGVIYNYDRTNGQPGPDLNGTLLHWAENGTEGTFYNLPGTTGSSPLPHLRLGTYFDNSGNVSISHIDMYGGSYGFGMSTGQINYIADTGGTHAFYTGASLATAVARINASGLSLGTAGSLAGSLVFLNATSGSITVTPPTGALGTQTITLPAASGTALITQRSTFSNANYTVLATDYIVAQIGTMSAAREVALPAASSFPTGRELIIIDESQTVTSTNTISLNPNGSDTLNGSSATQVAINGAGGYVGLVSDGVSKWTSERVSLGSSPLAGGGAKGTITVNNGATALIRWDVTNPPINYFFGESGNSTATGTTNLGFGRQSLQAVTSGSSNVGVGYLTLASVTSADQNTGIGGGAGVSATGTQNTFIGYVAGQTQTSGDGNTYIGVAAGLVMQTGSYNIHIGYFAGGSSYSNGADSNNIVIGKNVGYAAGGVSNRLNIANTIYATSIGADSTSAATSSIITLAGTTNSTANTDGALIIPGGVGIAKSLFVGTGTTAIVPLRFTAGTNLTTAVAGGVEYDGSVFYSSPVASTRGVSPSVHFLSLGANQTGSDTSSAQTWFPGGGATTITLPASTSYFFEGTLVFTKTAGTNARTVALLFGGAATITSIMYYAQAKTEDAAAPTLGTASVLPISAATATVVTASSASANQSVSVTVRGVVRINGAGTFIPQFQYSAAPGGAPTVLANTYFRMYPLGTNTVLNVGNWS